MQLLSVLIPLLGLVVFATYIWLVVIAFRRGAPWGLAMLFLSPFAMVIYVVKYWDESKKPFLIHVGSIAGMLAVIVLSFGLMLGGAAAQIETEMAKMQLEPTPIGAGASVADRGGAIETLHTDPAVDAPSAGHDEGPPTTDPSAETAAALAAAVLDGAGPVSPEAGLYLADPAPRGFRSIRLRDADHFVGRYVRFVDRNGDEHDGRIDDVGSGTITFVRHLTAGTFTFEYPTGEIERLYVAF